MNRVTHLMSTWWIAAATALAIPACVASGQASLHVNTPEIVVTEEPPQAQIEVEATQVRPNQVWVKGRWNWVNGQWSWAPGHWQDARAGYAWVEGRWERRGAQWVWVDGRWDVSSQPATVTVTGTTTTTVAEPPPAPTQTTTVVVTGPPVRQPTATVTGTVSTVGGGVNVHVSAFPTAAPPPLRVELQGTAPSRGHVWIAGHYQWVNGNYEWIGGRWELPPTGQVWVAGRWELQGDRYVWVEGSWQARARVQPVAPVVRVQRQ